MLKKIFNITLITVLCLLFVMLACLLALRYPTVQTYLAHRVTKILSKSLNTKVSVDRVSVDFFNQVTLQNFYMADHQGDTMIYAKGFQVSYKILDLLHRKINITGVAMDEGALHLRLDSTGEILNLADVFRNQQASEQKKALDTTRTLFSWDIDLNDVELRKTDFRYLDENSRQQVSVFVADCNIAAEKLNPRSKILNIKSIWLDNADIALETLKPGRELKLRNKKHEGLHFLQGDMQIWFGKLQLSNSRFTVADDNTDSVLTKGIDFKHLDITGINLTAKNGKIVGDTITAAISNLTAKERSGFSIKDMSTLAHVSVHDITLNNLSIKTGNSEINRYLSFHFNNFDNFNHFFDSVTIHANFADTRLAVKDLNYFLHSLNQLEHDNVTISGQIDGRINALRGAGIELRTGARTFFKGDFYLAGLPNIYETSLNLKIKELATTAEDIHKIYPPLVLPPNLNTLGLITYTGSLDGFMNDFVSTGKLVTSIGSATTDANFKYDRKQNKAYYEGGLTLTDFDLGKYFNDEKNLGKVSLDSKIDGRGLTLESLSANIDGNITSLTLLNHEYKDIKINGLVEKKSFSGGLKIKDDFLVLNFNGNVNFTHNIPTFNFDANIEKAELKNINLTKDDIRVSGGIKSDFSGNKLDNLAGTVDLSNINISRDSLNATIKQISLESKILNDHTKSITLNSDFADGEVDGHFNIRTLPGALIRLIKNGLTKNYQAPQADTASQEFSADISIYEPGNLTQILDPKFYFIHQTRITADLNSNKGTLNLTANIPQLTYGNYDIRRAELIATCDRDSFNFNSHIDRVYSEDSLLLDSLVFSSKTEGNDIRFDMSGSNKDGQNYANVTAYVTPKKDTTVIRLMPSDVKLGKYYWHFDPDNSISITGNRIISKNLVFKTTNQTLTFTSYLKNDTSTSVRLTMDNTDVGDFISAISSKTSDVVGNANGKLTIEDIFYQREINANMSITGFALGGQAIGDLDMKSSLDETGKRLNVSLSVKSAVNSLDATGYISIDPDNPGIKIDVDAPRFQVNFLNYQFFDRYVRNCRGLIAIKASFTGTLPKPVLTGEVKLFNDTATVSFLNTTYHISNQNVKLDEHGIDMGALTLYDSLNEVIYGSGRINYENFRDIELDLRVTSPGMQFLNTTEKQSPGFYGVAYGSGNVTFTGPVNSPTITAYAKTRPNTYCKLPVLSSYETGKYGFYKFETPEEKKKTSAAPQHHSLNGIDFMLNLDVTPAAKIDIILDPVHGDMLSGTGRGNLRIEIPRTGNTTMYGDYEIEDGKYLFTLQTLVNKPFVINKGGTVNFTGDIYKAGLNLDAVYVLHTSVESLIEDFISQSGNNALLSAAQSRVQVRLTMNLTGVLERPTIAFDIQAEDVDPTIKSYVDQKLAYLKSNDAEMNKQVVGLLVMNQFIPSTTSTATAISSSSYLSGTAANTLSEFLSSQLNNYMGNFFESTGNTTLQNLQMNLGYNQTYSQTSLNATTRQEVQVALQQRVLNNRLTLMAGGNLDFGSTASEPAISTNKSVIPTGDFQIEYALTPDGRLRAKAFNRTDYDYFNERNYNRTGIGLSYRQDFDKPGELFKKSKKKPKNAPASITPAPALKQDSVTTSYPKIGVR